MSEYVYHTFSLYTFTIKYMPWGEEIAALHCIFLFKGSSDVVSLVDYPAVTVAKPLGLPTHTCSNTKQEYRSMQPSPPLTPSQRTNYTQRLLGSRVHPSWFNAIYTDTFTRSIV